MLKAIYDSVMRFIFMVPRDGICTACRQQPIMEGRDECPDCLADWQSMSR